jgi:predicted permease
MRDILNDVRFAVRALLRVKGFTTIVVLTLALGIGANTAIFSVLRGVLLKPLPHRDGDRLVYLRQSADGPGRANLTFSVPEVRDLRNGVRALSGIAEFSSWSAILQRTDGPMRLELGLVTGNYFEVMGLSAVLGRVTQPGTDDGPTAAPVMVLAYETWLTRFGGDSTVVGSQVSVNNTPTTVIGVLQPAPFFPQRVDALMNMVISSHHMGASMQDGRTHRMTEVVARLRPAATLEQVRTEVSGVYRRLQNDFREAYDPAAHYRVAVMPFKQVLGDRARLILWLLMASAAFVLIVSVANVANLTLMRGVRREHEMVMRAALGAGTPTLRRLLLAENLVLAGAGAGVGVLIASNGLELLTTFAARFSPRASEIGLDASVFGFTLAVAITIAVSLSLLAPLPNDGGLAARLLAGAKRASAGLSKRRVQRSLVVVQIAVSVVLLASAGLLMRTLYELSKVETGLQTEDVLTMQVTIPAPAERYQPFGSAGRAEQVAIAIRHIEAMLNEIAGLPGVTDVGMGGTLPLRSSDFFNIVQVEGRPPAPGAAVQRSEFRSANPDYFRAAGIPLLRGRNFRSTDEGNVIINKTMADRFFPNENPVGRRIGWMMDWMPDTLKWQTVIGVVGTTRDGALDAEPRAVVFWPILETPTRSAGIVIRADPRVRDLAAQATNIVRRVDPGALVEDVMTISQFKAQSVSPRRLNAVLISSFGMLAVIIAMVGIAGVLAFSVNSRTNEIGIRMSLGADSGRVQRMILREGGALVALGLALGIAGAFLATRIMRELLFGVEPNDLGTFTVVALTMAAVGISACWIPALRAARIDPAVTMRA